MQNRADPRLLDAERLIQERLGGRRLDFDSMLAVSNIYRAATAVRRRAEKGVLSEFGLSWGGFTTLWVLWVWGEMQSADLADECDLAKGTLTGVVKTLEKRGFVKRAPVAADRRRVNVSLTDAGLATIEQLFPRFNLYEGEMVGNLSASEKQELAELLRRVIVTAGSQ
ncbi:MAG: MarR family transcriptional regulator [Acidimicrobiaceae bacterium]|nr:MarR family transcriptional regulator [Acidimicrobiaceae bacterium]MYB86324.1 MarR family transcriptional regulator [Acidimicrobiaceae bacterium]MYH78800.1 MarR family transcriptional regulator [Acidimicrobiaceae bacterium]MYH94501.1 MarR family transcriptional regulator [Acidimicrobiaceae bacterium]MYK77053.1 MarR family transcriptional regulator [Acidimicrobiaceae bacterium]